MEGERGEEEREFFFFFPHNEERERKKGDGFFRFCLSLSPHASKMARTMGEVLPRSFPDLFGCVTGPAGCAKASNCCEGFSKLESDNQETDNQKRHHHHQKSRVLFVDVGSGYGTLCHAAVAEYGCVASLGIEKYR